ncbi:MAG: hypothetical protein J5533_02665 [Bacteroidales bacterium]|nr:hypothetical protein [Bacteroidales bacterium]
MKRVFGILLFVFVFGGCCLVDEDLSGCPDNFSTDYEMRLITNVKTEINTVLGLEADIHVAKALREHLADIFSDFAHDVDLSFYDYAEPRPVLEHFTDIIDANQTSYTLNLPVYEYMHLAVANIMDNHMVSLEKEDFCSTARLHQEDPTEGNVISSHNTGLFTARLPMQILENMNQDFLVRLYMANCATALIIDRTGAPSISGLSAFTTGFASAFNIADSTYVFDRNPLVRAEKLAIEDGIEDCYVTVQFPSRDVRPDTKVVVETEDPFIAESADEGLWEWQVYVTLADGSITQNRLGIKKPLRAGQLKIIRIRIGEGGVAITDDSTVAASVQLDWQQAPEHNIEL